MELIGAFLPFIIMMAIMYFLLIRPQKKQQQKKKDMLNSLQAGDHVITIGGLYGIVDEVNAANDTVVLDCEGVYLTFTRPAIARTLEAGTTTREEILEETVAEEAVFQENEEDLAEFED